MITFWILKPNIKNIKLLEKYNHNSSQNLYHELYSGKFERELNLYRLYIPYVISMVHSINNFKSENYKIQQFILSDDQKKLYSVHRNGEIYSW